MLKLLLNDKNNFQNKKQRQCFTYIYKFNNKKKGKSEKSLCFIKRHCTGISLKKYFLLYFINKIVACFQSNVIYLLS